MTVLGGALQDLNDLYFFAAVVEHGGFSAAGRALGVPKSRLSKRVAQLEERLGVRLLQRTTRRFVVTEVGERFYAHCRAVLEEAQAAQDAVDELRAEPRGVVRLSCPVSLAQTVVAYVLPDFLALYPKMQVRVLSSDRRVDVIGEGYDLAIRVRSKLDTDANLVIRTFGQSRTKLVASPALLKARGRPATPEELGKLPALSMREHEGAQVWELIGANGEQVNVEVQARLITGDFAVLLEAAPAWAWRCCRSSSARRRSPAASSRWCCRSGACPRAPCISSTPVGAACCPASARWSTSWPSGCRQRPC